jgi:VIT1/CCC1 family predicted Fe2+/Mn2+ transporter
MSEDSRATQEAVEHIDVTRAQVARLSRVRELIFGAQDGLLTTLGLVSGVGAASGQRYTVLVAGIAGAFAGMIAMGAGAYISSKSQLEVHRAQVAAEERELRRHPERELEELVQLFTAEGLPEPDARIVAEKIAERPGAMLKVMVEKELGLVPDSGEPAKEGLVMSVAFLVGAVVPIAPWFLAGTHAFVTVLGEPLSPALLLSAAATVVVLFVIGTWKSSLAHKNPLRGGLEVMGIGLVAATTGFMLGTIFPHLVGAPSIG